MGAAVSLGVDQKYPFVFCERVGVAVGAESRAGVPTAVQEERQRSRERSENEAESTSSGSEDMPVERILEAELAVEPKTEAYSDVGTESSVGEPGMRGLEQTNPLENSLQVPPKIPPQIPPPPPPPKSTPQIHSNSSQKSTPPHPKFRRKRPEIPQETRRNISPKSGPNSVKIPP